MEEGKKENKLVAGWTRKASFVYHNEGEVQNSNLFPY